jgi:hypothetical protein
MATEKRHGSIKHSDEGQRDRPRASAKSEHRFPQDVPDGDGTAAEREYDDYALAERDSDSEEPDVLLDVPVLKVDEINLDVEQLRARISLQAEVLDLLRLNVGADVFVGQVELEIKGVEAQALLKVRLDNVARILDRVLTTIDRNPQILEQITRGVRSAVEEVGGGAADAVGELGEGAGAAIEDVGEGAGAAVEDVGEGAGAAVEDVGEGAGEAVEDVGEGAGSAVEDTGETARRTAEGAGKTVRRVAGRGSKTAKKVKRTPEKEAARRVKRSKGQSSRRTRASDDRSSRS